jgi:hypothetical protein
VTPAKVEAAVERIAAAVRPLRILAFGSRARGDTAPEARVSSVIQDALQGLLLCIDVLVIEKGRFERLRGHATACTGRLAAKGSNSTPMEPPAETLLRESADDRAVLDGFERIDCSSAMRAGR